MDYNKIISYVAEQLTEEEKANPLGLVRYIIDHTADFSDMTVVDNYFTTKETQEKTARLARPEVEVAKLKQKLGV